MLTCLCPLQSFPPTLHAHTHTHTCTRARTQIYSFTRCRLSTKHVVQRVKKILTGKDPQLVQGFNMFLPPEHKIKPVKYVYIIKYVYMCLFQYAFAARTQDEAIRYATHTHTPYTHLHNIQHVFAARRSRSSPSSLLLCCVLCSIVVIVICCLPCWLLKLSSRGDLVGAGAGLRAVNAANLCVCVRVCVFARGLG